MTDDKVATAAVVDTDGTIRPMGLESVNTDGLRVSVAVTADGPEVAIVDGDSVWTLGMESALGFAMDCIRASARVGAMRGLEPEEWRRIAADAQRAIFSPIFSPPAADPF